MLRRGARVAVFFRNIRKEIVESRFPQEYRDTDRVRFFTVDITIKETIEKALDAIIAVWDVPEILINNAGIDTQPSAPPEVSGPF